MKLPKKEAQDTASTEELQFLNNTFSYQVTPIALQDELFRCPDLTARAQLTWIYLHNHKDFHTHSAYYNAYQMARVFGKDVKTIQRSVNLLLGLGWLTVTKYNRDNSPAELRVTMPRDILKKILEGTHRKEGPLNFENKERFYCRDAEREILFSYYINPNGSQTIVLSEDIDIHEAARLLEHGLIGALPVSSMGQVQQNSVAEPSVLTPELNEHQTAPEPRRIVAEVTALKPVEVKPIALTDAQKTIQAELETQIKEKDEKIQSGELMIMAKLVLVGERNVLLKEKRELEGEDENVPIPYSKYVNLKQVKNTITSPNVNPPARKNNCYVSKNTQAGMREPISYRNNPIVDVPKKCIRAVEQAVEDNKTRISDPSGVIKEVLWSIAKLFVGKPRSNPNASLGETLIFNTRAAIKILRETKWTKPAGFTPQEEIDAERKAEADKENKLRRRNNYDGYISSPMDMADLKTILGI